MEVYIKNIQREISELYADSRMVFVAENNLYEVDFYFRVGEKIVDASLTIVYGGDLSFNKAKELIRETLSNEVKDHATD